MGESGLISAWLGSEMMNKTFFSRYYFLCGLLFSVLSGISNAQPLDDVSLEFQSQGVVATIRPDRTGAVPEPFS